MSRGLRKERRALYGGEYWARKRLNEQLAKIPAARAARKVNRVFMTLKNFMTAPARKLLSLFKIGK